MAGNAVRRWTIAPLLLLIRLYQVTLSPLLGPCCRFTPSCSRYAVEALQIHGLMRGLVLAVWRVLRCNPWCRGGVDPVPPDGQWRMAFQRKSSGNSVSLNDKENNQ